MNNCIIELSNDKLSRETLNLFLQDVQEFGANSIFVGVVRDNNLNRKVCGIYFDCHTEICKIEMEKILEEVKSSITDDIKIYFSHRIGEVVSGEDCVIIGVATRHREDAFQACRYIIEETKSRLPIWKKEILADNTTVWLDGVSLNECQK